jgi:hypothetical protein
LDELVVGLAVAPDQVHFAGSLLTWEFIQFGFLLEELLNKILVANLKFAFLLL